MFQFRNFIFQLVTAVSIICAPTIFASATECSQYQNIINHVRETVQRAKDDSTQRKQHCQQIGRKERPSPENGSKDFCERFDEIQSSNVQNQIDIDQDVGIIKSNVARLEDMNTTLEPVNLAGQGLPEQCKDQVRPLVNQAIQTRRQDAEACRNVGAELFLLQGEFNRATASMESIRRMRCTN